MRREKKLYSVKMRASKEGFHISGAESIVRENFLESTVLSFLRRALNHPRGRPDFINIKLEELKEYPTPIQLLPVFEISGSYNGEALAEKLLSASPLGANTAKRIMEFLRSNPSMRGASIMDLKTGKRLEPDRKRGVRASYLGISNSAEEKLRKSAGNSFTRNFKEALLLSSKILSHPASVVEICISDDPDYTTGYVSFKGLGYFRIFNIKPRGAPWGGRVIVIRSSNELIPFIEFIQKQPVIANSFTSYSVISPEEAVKLIEENFSSPK